jgi:hypothetical protein
MAVTPPPYSMEVTLVITLADRADVLGTVSRPLGQYSVVFGTIILQFSIQLLSFWIILGKSFSSNKTNVFFGFRHHGSLMFDHQRDDLGRTRDHFGDFRWCFWAPWQPFAPPYSHEPCLKLHLVRNINVKMRNLQNVYTSYVHGGFSWVLKPYIFKIHHSMFKFGALWMRPFKAPTEDDVIHLSLAQKCFYNSRARAFVHIN